MQVPGVVTAVSRSTAHGPVVVLAAGEVLPGDRIRVELPGDRHPLGVV